MSITSGGHSGQNGIKIIRTCRHLILFRKKYWKNRDYKWKIVFKAKLERFDKQG